MQPHDMRGHGLAQALRRDRLVVLLGLAAITVLAWVYILNLSTQMQGMGQAVGQAMGMTAMGQPADMAAMQSAMSGVQP